MTLKDFFKKKNNEIDPLKDLILSKLRMGYLVDYDMKTWEVTGYNRYDFGEGSEAFEWELTSGREKSYLELSEDDEVEWSISKKVSIGAIEGNIRHYIIENQDPPEKVFCREIEYFLDESGAGYLYENDEDPAKEFVYWDFIDKDDKHFLTIEQWGETEFEASIGDSVEEYQFTNILPGNPEDNK